MQHNTFRKIIKASVLAGFCMMVISFSHPTGGDLIEIFLNKKLLLQQYVPKEPTAKSISLGASDIGKQLDVYYKHCGLAGKSRTITLKNKQHNSVKEWHFTDATANNACMTIMVKDIFSSVTKVDGSGQLYYFSKEIPAGRLLTEIVFQHQSVAMK